MEKKKERRERNKEEKNIKKWSTLESRFFEKSFMNGMTH